MSGKVGWPVGWRTASLWPLIFDHDQISLILFFLSLLHPRQLLSCPIPIRLLWPWSMQMHLFTQVYWLAIKKGRYLGAEISCTASSLCLSHSITPSFMHSFCFLDFASHASRRGKSEAECPDQCIIYKPCASFNAPNLCSLPLHLFKKPLRSLVKLTFCYCPCILMAIAGPTGHTVCQ